MASATVSASMAQGLLAFAVQNGAERGPLIAAAGLHDSELLHPDDRVPLSGYVRLIDAAKRATGMPAFPILWAEAMGMADLSIVGLIMESAPTMGAAFAQLQRYSRLAIDAAEEPQPSMVLSNENGRLFLVHARSPLEGGADLVESAFVHLSCGPRRFLPRPHILSVQLMREAPPYAVEYERIFQCPVEFGTARNALELHPEVAEWPVSKSGGYLAEVLAKHADDLVLDLEAQKTWRGKTKVAILEELHQGALSADRIAQRLGFSRQTLFRRLQSENATYEAVLDEARERLAKLYIGEKRLGVTETAFLLGFQEAASFTRAFKRWTGATPSKFAKEAARSEPRDGR